MRGLFLIAALSLLIPGAGASWSVETAITQIIVEDRRQDDCTFNPYVGCAMDFYHDGGGPANFTLDAYQDLHYIGVAADFGAVKGAMGDLWLLPDDSVSIHRNFTYVEHPVFRIATEMWQQLDLPEESREYYWITLSPEAITVGFYGPSTMAPTDIQHREMIFPYFNGSIGYESIGPVRGVPGNSTDNYLDQNRPHACRSMNTPECWQALNDTLDLFQAHAPNAWVGLEFYQAEIATDPSILTYGAPPPGPVEDTSAETRLVSEIANVGDEDARAATLRPETTADEPPVDEAHPKPIPPPAEAETVMQMLSAEHPASVALIAAAVALAGSAALLAWIAWALYSRIHSRGAALESPHRQRLLDLVRDRGAVPMTSAVETLGLSRTATMNHVQVLQRIGMLRVESSDGRIFLYPAGVEDTTAPPGIPRAVSEHPVQGRILRLVRSTAAGIMRRDVHRHMADVPVRTRNHALRRLLDKGLIEERLLPKGETIIVTIRPNGVEWTAAPGD